MRRIAPSATAFTLVATLSVAALVFFMAGCGGGGKSSSSDSKKAAGAGSPGEKVFTNGGCGGCHTMEAAGATGKVGPNLDELRPNQETVARQVRNGGNGMPSFKGKLTPTEISQVAAFVSTAAGTGRAGKISFEPNDQKVDDCKDTTCYEQAFGNMAYNDGPKAALQKLASLSSSNGSVSADCHPIAHKIGAGGLLYFKGDVGKAFADGDATCGSGYYHGLLQWKLAGVSADQVSSVASTVCKAPEIETNAFIYYQCNHGLGHGLMLYTALDLPRALDYCHKLQTEEDSIMCSGGVFMENQSSSFVQQQVRRPQRQALLLPARHIAHPPVRPRQLDEDGRLVPQGRAGLDPVLLPVVGPGRLRCRRPQPAADEGLLRPGR
jgi:mono/diheme cytochrome c family protein